MVTNTPLLDAHRIEVSNLNIYKSYHEACTYFIIGRSKFVKMINKFENLVMMYFTDRWRVVKEHNLYLGCHTLLLFVIFTDNIEWFLQLKYDTIYYKKSDFGDRAQKIR